MKIFDAITVGDAIVDLFISLPDQSDHYHVDKAKNELDLLLGEKNPVDSSNFSLGGNASHVAIGLSRLGFTTALAAEIGTDSFATQILSDLEKEHILSDLLLQTKGAKSSFTVSLSVANDRITFPHHELREHDFSFDTIQTEWVYLTSLGDKWEKAYRNVAEFIKKTGAKLVFNPGSMQLQSGAKSFADITALCDVLIINKEEAEEILYGEVLPHEKKETPESLLFRLNRLNSKIAVITDGENGSWVIDEEAKIFSQPVFKVTITEKTGAGDGFSAGFLAGLMSKKDLQTCLLWGTANAAGVITKVGGNEGLLTKTELERKIEENQ